jgi:hypothetical protein
MRDATSQLPYPPSRTADRARATGGHRTTGRTLFVAAIAASSPFAPPPAGAKNPILERLDPNEIPLPLMQSRSPAGTSK